MPTPVITSSPVAFGSVGTAFSYQITASNTPTSFGAFRRFGELYPGLTFNSANGIISGTPTVVTPANIYINLSATNASGTGIGHLLLNILATTGYPVITSALTANATVGTPFSYQITATPSPTSWSSPTPLPDGLSMNFSGLISGTPIVEGAQIITLTVANANGSTQRNLRYQCLRTGGTMPVITSPLEVVWNQGSAISYQITATNSPVSYGAITMPNGLTINTTGLITGIPNTSGNGDFSVTAKSAANPNSGVSVVKGYITGGILGPPLVITQGIWALIRPPDAINPAVLTNVNVAGVMIEEPWSTIETALLTYNFTSFTPKIDQVIAGGKKISLRILTGGGALAQGGYVPNHVLIAMGVADPASHTFIPGVTYSYDKPLGTVITIPVPYHPIYIQYKRALYRAFRAYLNALTTTQKAAIQSFEVSLTDGEKGSNAWLMPHNNVIVSTGGPGGSGYALSEAGRWLNATDAVPPGAGYTTAKFISMAMNKVNPIFTGAIMLTTRNLFHATANFTAFDIGRGVVGGITFNSTIASVVDAQNVLLSSDVASIGTPFTLTIVGRDNGLLADTVWTQASVIGAINSIVTTEAGPMGTLLDAAVGGADPSNYVTKTILGQATANGGRFILTGAVSTQVPNEPNDAGTEWANIDLLWPNFVPTGGRDIFKVWGDTADTGGSGYIMNGGTPVDPDGQVPNPPGLNAVLILRKAAERFSTYKGSYIELWQEDVTNQATTDLAYIKNLMLTGLIFPPPPVITSPLTASGKSGTTISYQVTATGNPFTFGMAPASGPGYNIGFFVDTTGEAMIGLAAPGVYPIELSAISSIGFDNKTLMLTVGPPDGGNIKPVAGFTYTTSLLKVTFTDNSHDTDGTIASRLWLFGDGKPNSTAINPVHTYAAAGQYIVTLNVTDNGGLTAFYDTTVTVGTGGNILPVADFDYVLYDTELKAVFTDRSTDADGTIVAWSWLFGDGGLDTVKNPQHVYAAPGNYTIKLIVNDSGGGTSTISKTIFLGGPDNQPPVANFSFTTTDLRADFSNLSADPEGGAITSHWMFGDNDSSDDPSPTHFYARAGNYTVLLIVTDPEGNTGTKTQTITVGDVAVLGDAGDQNVGVSAPLDPSLRSNLKAVCKLRWVPKEPSDLMVIRNLDALRIMCDAIIHEQNGEWDKAEKAKMRAGGILEAELKEYLSGIQHTVQYTSDNTFGMGDLGEVL